jgi:hypothetical protein
VLESWTYSSGAKKEEKKISDSFSTCFTPKYYGETRENSMETKNTVQKLKREQKTSFKTIFYYE